MFRKYTLERCGIAAAAMVSLVPTVARAGVEYTLIDLGSADGQSAAFAVRNLPGPAVVVGAATASDAHFQSVRFDPTPTALIPLPPRRETVGFAIDGSGGIYSVAYTLGSLGMTAVLTHSNGSAALGEFAPRATNPAGEVAGTTRINSGGLIYGRVCRYSGGVLTTLPTLGGTTAQAFGIDESGRVVGSAFSSSDAASRPCLWVGTTAIDLGTLAGTSASQGQAFAIRSGAIVGHSKTAAGVWHATRWTVSSGGQVLTRTDLGAPAGTSSFAHAVNASGSVVGTGGFHALLWKDGQVIDLNTVTAAPAGWTLENAWAIGDDGRIAGTGSYLGVPRAFLLAPGNCGGACIGDLDCNGFVDDADFVRFAANYDLYTVPPADGAADFNLDGFVDDHDFVIFAGVYDRFICP